jgi:hypothetical protein
MSCSGSASCMCVCCSGISVQTPAVEGDLPGLSSITYRTGTWATFKQSMLARLSSSEFPALSFLKTRDDDDFSIALLDASSVVLDILTFYQERLANESYLRTARQLQSLTELARLIGYQPAPGVAASTYLAFSLKVATGLPPDPSTKAITIPAGTQVQSVPEQRQTPQTFETSADIFAKPDWNALAVQTGVPWLPPGHKGMYLSGTALQLSPGDSLLILGADRENWTPGPAVSQQWEVVVLKEVREDTVRKITYVAWDPPLLHESSSSVGGWTTAKIFVFRQKVGLFGNSAPSPYLFTNANATGTTSIPHLIEVGTSGLWHWRHFKIKDSDHIDLSASCPKIVVGSWFALTVGGKAELYKVKKATAVSLAEFGLSAKVTELAADFPDSKIAAEFPLQDSPGNPGTEVWAQSNELVAAEQPLDDPLYGTFLDLETVRPDLAGVQAVAITGNAQKLSVKTGVAPALVFTPDDTTATLTLKPGDIVTILDPAPLPLTKKGGVPHWRRNTKTRDLRVIDSAGRAGTIAGAQLSNFTLAPSSGSDPVVQEFALVSTMSEETSLFPHTRLFLRSKLLHCYDRATAKVNANVGLATNGSSVSEILGSGSAAIPNQEFSLKQWPLTFVQSPTPTGLQSTLKVTANQSSWTEVPSLYQQPPTARVFATLNQPGGRTDLHFGDTVEAATLPTGQNNIQAIYRIGSGLAGNVGAGSITTLIDRPIGVSGVINPTAATGGQDPQSVDDIRANAPLSVLTLGRAVSIVDYQNFAASFAGIAKAHAIWIPSGPGRGVFVTVAAAGGWELPPGNPTLTNLVASLQNYGNPLIPINAASFLETLFSIDADLAYDPSYDQTAVLAAVQQSLRQNYSFASRTFGQGVSGDEVAALIQSVPGVVAVNVTKLTTGFTSQAGDITGGVWSLNAYYAWLSQPVTITRLCSGSPTRICPYLPVANPTQLPNPAEILVLDPNPANNNFGVMP